MITTTKKFEFEIPYLLVAIALGSFLRLYQLGSLPLSDREAALALDALNFSKGIFTPSFSNTLYTNFTAGLFYFFTSSNFFARFLPAFAGILLLFAPLLFQKTLGKNVAFVLTLLLAIDPTLVALSRSVNLVILPLTTLLWLLAAFTDKRSKTIGVLLGLFLLSGPQVWFGILALILTEITLLIFRWNVRLSTQIAELNKKQLREMIVPFLLTYALFGSFFLLNPAGLGSIISSIQGLILQAQSANSVGAVVISPVRSLLTLGVYEIFGIVFFLLGLKNLFTERRPVFSAFGIASLIAVIIAIIHPARNPLDIVWVVPFLLLVAALFISDFIENFGSFTREIQGMTLFTTLLLVFAVLNIFSIALVTADVVVTQMRWSVLIGSITLLIISFVLVTYGWSFQTASKGITTGFLVFFFMLNIPLLVSISHLKANGTDELSDPYPQISTDNVLLRQMKDVSRWNQSSDSLKKITSVAVDSPALTWMLKDFEYENVSEIPSVDELGLIIITPDGFSNDELEGNYRGQNIFWSYDVPFEQLTWADWMKWSVNHSFPKSENKLILWIRADQFIDQQNN